MNQFQYYAKNEQARFKAVRKAFQNECRQFKPGEFTKIDRSELIKDGADNSKAPLMAFRSREFFAAIYLDRYDDRGEYMRLSVNRCKLDNDGQWVGDITWDELMEIKRATGFADAWFLECYPPEDEIVNVANMRHLFFLPKPPAFAWLKDQKPSTTQKPSILGKIRNIFRK